MAARIPLNFVGEAYRDDTLPFSSQESINCELIPAETDGARSRAIQAGTPGLKSFATVGTGTIRGSAVFGESAYFVADTGLYRVASDGSASASLGTIEGSGRVAVAENGSELIVVNGSKAWTYDGAAFAQVTDADYPGSVDCFFLDQYIIHIRGGGSQQFFLSALDDATSYDAADFASAESATDGLLGGAALNGDAWLFGGSSIEVWQNTGAADFPLERIQVIEKGIAGTFAKVKLDNTIYWLGNNGIVYRAEGYSARRVSTRPIEQALGEETLSEAFAMAYEDKGNAYFILSFPNGRTWAYNVVTGKWHRRKSFEMSRWRANDYLFAYGKHLFGDTTSGKVWELDPDTYTEGSDPLIWERKTQYVHADGEYVRAAELELEFDVGNGLNTGQGSNPVVELCYSDDGGRTFSNWRQASLGLTGKYQARVRFHGLGRFRQRLFHIRISDPVPRTLIAASGRAYD